MAEVRRSGGRKIVVKVGSSFLTNRGAHLDVKRLKVLTDQVVAMRRAGHQVVLVSSGAIACGMGVLGYTERPKNLAQLQAAAAIGQTRLMHDYERLFRRQRIVTAQILLTPDDLDQRVRYLNARNTIHTLLEQGIVPIVNENDTVATDEIKFGDNDRLSALVATAIDASLVIILSDVPGLYDTQGKVIPQVRAIDDFVKNLAQGTKRQTSVGGMVTKIEAARIATNAGIPLVIASGSQNGVLMAVVNNEPVGTWFMPRQDVISGKKRWIAFSCRSCGRIVVDDGAQEAITKKGKSLLAGGVVTVEGTFQPGELVLVCDRSGREIARGLSNYAYNELLRIKGKKTSQIKSVLGYKSYDEVIHRNNMVVVE